MSYEYVNTSTTLFPPIIYSSWEVKDSSNNVLGTLEGVGRIDFIFAFPFLDEFTITLTVKDSFLNENTEIKIFNVDECPYILSGGGPSIPELYENNKKSGRIIVDKIKADDIDYCSVVKAKIISDEYL
jgi:hypothetical protein